MASWVLSPNVLPLATFKRNNIWLGFRNSSKSNLFQTKLSWARVSPNTFAITSFFTHLAGTFKCNKCNPFQNRPPPPPQPPVVGAGGRGPPPDFHERGVAGVGTRHQPDSARFCELALRAVGPAEGLPVGGTWCLREGCPGWGTLPLPTASRWSRRPGPVACFRLARGGAGVGTRHQPQSTPSCELTVRAVGAARGRPENSASCLHEGCPGCRALCISQQPVVGAEGCGLLPVFPGHGGCGHGDPSTTQQRSLLPSGLARCGGGTRAPGGGDGTQRASLYGIGGWALSLPQPIVLGAGGRGALVVCRGRGGTP